MNITIITSSLPYPLKSGGAQAQYNFINTLREQHSFSIICPENRINTRQSFKELQKCWPDVEIHIYPYFRQMLYLPFLTDKIARAIKLKLKPQNERFRVERALKPYGYNLSKDFLCFVNKHIERHHTDIIQVDFYPYLHIVNYLPYHIKKIFVQHEIRYIRNERLLASFHLTSTEKDFFSHIKQQEIDDINLYDSVLTLTQTDKTILENDGVRIPIFVSPAAVNSPILPYKGWNGNISFVGGYNHIPNHEGMDWFISKVIPLLQMEHIKAINVIGGGWPQKYARIHPKLHFLGFVENLPEAVYGSLLIVPILTGSGMRMKILDAAAMGVPFITTSIGVEGLDFNHNQSCIIADEPIEFANAINQLISDDDRMKHLADHAQTRFLQKYSVKALSKVRVAIYEQLSNI